MLDLSIAHKGFRSADGHTRTVIAGLSLTLTPGSFTCLVGPSGCGKSTLLNLITGLDNDFDGHVRYNDSRAPTVMFQEPRLMPWLTVLDNVLLVAREPRRARAAAIALLDEMGLGDALGQYPLQLSGGMQRRVALARAFLDRPSLLLMDEPFASLDAPTAARLRQMLLARWQQQRAAVLFVTHDLSEAAALADRIVFLSTAPAQIVLDQPVDLARPREAGDAAVRAWTDALLARHPGLLEGQPDAHPVSGDPCHAG